MPARDDLNTIIVSPAPAGRFKSVIIDGTPKPGTVLQLKAGVAPVNGVLTYEVYDRGADGDRPQGAVAILPEDRLQGRTIYDAYESGQLAEVYFPVPGDEFLMLLQDVGGTGDTRAVGDIYVIDNGTGTLIPTASTPETEAFVLLENLAAPTADVLGHVQFSGY